MLSPDELKKKATGNKKKHKKLFRHLKSLPQKTLDNDFSIAHEEVFACTDCLQCANCCKTTGPLFTSKDIERLARHFSISPGVFFEKYLRTDEEGDDVLQELPCPFLLPDNRCSVYEVRPKACREFPHTDRRNMREILDITYKNISVCPAVFEIVEKLSTISSK